jgi:two-component sensor histidine kinase
MIDIEKPFRELRPSKVDNYRRIGNFYLITGQYGKARHYLDEALRLTTLKISMNYTADIHLLLFRADSAQGRYLESIAHYQRYKVLNDSIFNVKQSRQIANLQIQYKTREKEQNIALLTKQNEIQQARLKQRDFLQQVIVAGACMLLLLLAVIYNRYRLKLRSNRLLEAKQQEINQKNEHLSELLGEKDSLLGQKDTLIEEKEGLLKDKDHLLTEQGRLLLEKERLLKEIHHRVKNNLQVVMNLLSLQADSLLDQAALMAIRESQHRVQAMALIHQKLYQAEGVARIPMQDYVEEVVAYLHESYYLNQLVRLRVEVEPIELDVTQAVPLGLIINEALTNAFKYAFPEGRPGTVSLSMLRLGEATYQLTIADDGVGLPKKYDAAGSQSLGMMLLHGFSEQLGGALTLSSPPGLTINLVFEEEQLNPSYAPAAWVG